MGVVTLRGYVQHTTERVDIDTALVANAELLWTLGTTPNRSAIILKMVVFNATGGNDILHVGDTGVGIAFVERFPDLYLANGLNLFIADVNMPEYEFFNDIYVYADTVLANDIQVIATVAEIF